MFIVSKLKPDKIIKTANGSGLVRIFKYGDTTSESEREHITNMLNDLHNHERWVICDCRPELGLLNAPGLSVVRRRGVLFLRNLPSREEHVDGCKFKYVKSLPWLSQQNSITPQGSDESVSEDFSMGSPEILLRHLIIKSEWVSCDPEYSFLSMIKKVSNISESITVNGNILSNILEQSVSKIFTTDDTSTDRVLMFITHSIDWVTQSLIRADKENTKSLSINGGIVPARPVEGPLIEGPYLTLVTEQNIAGEIIRACSYIPVSERKYPVPVLTEDERQLSKIIRAYFEWIYKAEEHSMGYGKKLSDICFMDYGLTLISSNAILDLSVVDSADSILCCNDEILIGREWLKSCSGRNANELKAKIRGFLVI
jgi:hypothetical protein